MSTSIDLKRAVWRESPQQVVAHYQSNAETGLTAQEAQRRQTLYGRNELPSHPPNSIFKLILEQFSDVLVLILLGAAVISFVLALFEDSEEKLTAFVEPAVILIILIVNAFVGVLQETKAEAAIEALRESEAREATVIRDGKQFSMHAADIVPGDIIVVAVGDKVPADARLTEFATPTLLVDEALLTGESESAFKDLRPINKESVVNQDKRNIIFSGTLVVRGKAKAIVTTTGSLTEFGQIASELTKKDDEKTPLQEKLDEFGEQLSKIIAIICVVVWLMNIGHFTDPDHGSALRGAVYYFKIAVALAVAAIPEGLPAVVTTCLALGTMKMAKKNAIVRSLPSVETLGSTTTICCDKTGTLTTNQMSVQKVLGVESATLGQVVFREYNVEGDSFAPYGKITVKNQHHEPKCATNDTALSNIGRICALCNEATLAWKPAEGTKAGMYTKTGAPTEAALLVLAEKIGTLDTKLNEQTASLPEYDRANVASRYWSSHFTRKNILEFDRDRKSMSVIVNDGHMDSLLCKGAPESVLERCTRIRDGSGKDVLLTPAVRKEIQDYQERYASEGLRCLALSLLDNIHVHFDLSDMSNYSKIESGMTFIGLVSMLDPPRAAVPDAIMRCRSAGINVIVITGDNKLTAESICRRIGVFDSTEETKGMSFSGAEFDALSPVEKRSSVGMARLFSRVEPRHKLEIIKLLQEQGAVCCMTGDGVNDASALRKADIGISMGSGTDVAREASKMVLQDDNFATIVMAVEEGRSIYANTKQFIRYLISSNIGEVACIFITAALGMPEALIPVQLLWVNLVTDGLPATALGFNPPDPDVMLKPPRGRTESIINRWTFFRYLVIGTYIGIGTIGGFIWWYLFSQNGPQLSWEQLTNFHTCANDINGLYKGINCEIFHNARPSTVSLSILVTIEMFNALNALSEDQSLLSVTPMSNLYVVAACALSFALHFIILYTPFFASIFHAVPLSVDEWKWVLIFSLPVFVLDEILKLVSRRTRGSSRPKQKTD